MTPQETTFMRMPACPYSTETDFGQVRQAGLGRAVRGTVRAAHVSGDGADADDRAAGPLREEHLQRGPREPEDVREVQVDDEVPLLVGDLGERRPLGEQRVTADDGHQCVQTAEPADGLGHEPVDLGCQPDVAHQRQRVSAALDDLFSGLSRTVGIDVYDR
jgi:hypothetical protein